MDLANAKWPERPSGLGKRPFGAGKRPFGPSDPAAVPGDSGAAASSSSAMLQFELRISPRLFSWVEWSRPPPGMTKKEWEKKRTNYIERNRWTPHRPLAEYLYITFLAEALRKVFEAAEKEALGILAICKNNQIRVTFKAPADFTVPAGCDLLVWRNSIELDVELDIDELRSLLRSKRTAVGPIPEDIAARDPFNVNADIENEDPAVYSHKKKPRPLAKLKRTETPGVFTATCHIRDPMSNSDRSVIRLSELLVLVYNRSKKRVISVLAVYGDAFLNEAKWQENAGPPCGDVAAGKRKRKREEEDEGEEEENDASDWGSEGDAGAAPPLVKRESSRLKRQRGPAGAVPVLPDPEEADDPAPAPAPVPAPATERRRYLTRAAARPAALVAVKSEPSAGEAESRPAGAAAAPRAAPPRPLVNIATPAGLVHRAAQGARVFHDSLEGGSDGEDEAGPHAAAGAPAGERTAAGLAGSPSSGAWAPGVADSLSDGEEVDAAADLNVDGAGGQPCAAAPGQGDAPAPADPPLPARPAAALQLPAVSFDPTASLRGIQWPVRSPAVVNGRDVDIELRVPPELAGCVVLRLRVSFAAFERVYLIDAPFAGHFLRSARRVLARGKLQTVTLALFLKDTNQALGAERRYEGIYVTPPEFPVPGMRGFCGVVPPYDVLSCDRVPGGRLPYQQPAALAEDAESEDSGSESEGDAPPAAAAEAASPFAGRAPGLPARLAL
eukprot:tig00021312_g20095.t1